jgi:Family of unknown function (DUF5694)
MIVGIAHLVARNDVHNSQFTDSPLTPKRQAEIADVVARLGQFHPTKVLIEAAAGDPKFAERYSAYLKMSYTLPADETYQFGFRLAAGAGNATIYPIDTWGPSIVDDASASGKRIDAYLEKNLSNVADPVTNDFIKRQEQLERTGTYLDLLRYLNTDQAIRASASWYSVVDGMGRESDDAGASYVAQWYTRNSYIFANLLGVVAPADRVVVIIGQGHEYLLREFVRLNPNLSDVDPLQFLK